MLPPRSCTGSASWWERFPKITIQLRDEKPRISCSKELRNGKKTDESEEWEPPIFFEARTTPKRYTFWDGNESGIGINKVNVNLRKGYSPKMPLSLKLGFKIFLILSILAIVKVGAGVWYREFHWNALVKFDMRIGIDCSHVRKEIGKDWTVYIGKRGGFGQFYLLLDLNQWLSPYESDTLTAESSRSSWVKSEKIDPYKRKRYHYTKWSSG